MTVPIRHIRGHLRASEAVAALLVEVERRERLLSTVQGAVPAALARHCRQVTVDAGRLTLFVDSPAWVDRLRFLSPQFVDALTTLGIAIHECRVRVLPGAGPADAPSRLPGHGPRSAVAEDCLNRAAAVLGERPLAATLRRLARTCGPR